ncbi:MAG: hypothetical protein ACD_58C00200G0007 [uncultured bacterium]|nr:MAG: hypothetical protein ACD_58C00200G0007 [uncultured bacterium]
MGGEFHGGYEPDIQKPKAPHIDHKAIEELLKNHPELIKEGQDIEARQKQESNERYEKQKQERDRELTSWLEIFDQNLSAGEPHARARGLMESIGIYKNGKHLIDVYSQGFKFGKNEFVSEVAKALNMPIPQSKEKKENISGLRIDISPEAEDLFKGMGVEVIGNTLYLKKGEYKKVDLYSGGENIRIKFDKVGRNDISLTVVETTGKIIEYQIRSGELDLYSRKEK